MTDLKPGQELTYEQTMDLPDGAIVAALYGSETTFNNYIVGGKDAEGEKSKFSGATLYDKTKWNKEGWNNVLLLSMPGSQEISLHPIMDKIVFCPYCKSDTLASEYHDCKEGHGFIRSPRKYDIIHLDMDGVIVDFTKAVLQYFAWPLDTFIDNYEMERVLKISKDEMLQCYNSSHDFWANMEKLPWADDIFEWAKANSNKVMFLSSPSNHPNSYSGKVAWLHKHYPEVDFALVTSKSPSSRPGTLLIDDYYPNVVKFRRFGGHAAIFPRPWNCGLQDQGQDKIKLIKLDIEKYHGGSNA